MYAAKDFETFYNVAAWARQNVNCGLFIDAIYSVVLHRRDTVKIVLPPPYEILPNYFIKKDLIEKASLLLSGNELTISNDIHAEGNTYTIDANYTTDLTDNVDESMLAYFLEDIGLNSYNFLKRLQNSQWIKNGYSNRFGDYCYHYIKQLIARFNLERYANGFPEIESISLNDVYKNYDSKLIYSNGHEFPERISGENMENLQEFVLLKSIEDNLGVVVANLVCIILIFSSVVSIIVIMMVICAQLLNTDFCIHPYRLKDTSPYQIWIAGRPFYNIII